MMQMTATQRNWIIVIAIIVIAALYYFMDFKPKYDEIAEQKATIAQQQQTYSDLERVASEKPQYLALTKQIQQRLHGVELTADPRAYIPSYLKQIETLATRDGLTVLSVVPAPPTPTPAPVGSPAASPNATAIENAPVVGAPLKSAARVAGAENANTAQTAGVGQAVGVAGATAIPGFSPAPVNASGAAGAPTPPPNSARAAAISYLSQSFTQVPVNMDLEGTFADFQRFLRDLNKFPKLIGVGDVVMTPTGSTGVGETPRIHVSLPIVAYRLSSNAAPARTPAPVAK